MATLYIDGASAGSPGPSGAGIFMKQGGKQWRHSVPLHPMTNNEAEFHACLLGLSLAQEEGFNVVSICSDSQVLVDAVEKRFIKNKSFRPLLEEILTIMDQFEACFIKWIPTKENREADVLAKKAVQKARNGTSV
ncbi:ribonuclease HI [Alkalicoccus urumqiensis]|uniref:Ribonuclease HI n=1 Tax=Alkalicoccus urumqiensis TaxID=1548213 RepID=A0A2P6MDW5_ALKUR|nr:ribonuclease HI family protein [Alkalicoccus urumqiensis]PRO64469.1 ribonuclease HI [Alkalicoccus urumqiensis]